MAPLGLLHSLGPEDSVSHALERMEASNMGRLAVMRNGEVLGFISREEVLRFARNARRHRM
jgi:CBS domain-containing protein